VEYVENSGWREQIAADNRALLARIVGEVLVDARAGAPVDTGALRDSLESEVRGETGRIGTNENYGIYVEEGHRVGYAGPDGVTVFTGEVVPPQPYLRPALYRKRGGG
jgi:hypothetical protein